MTMPLIKTQEPCTQCTQPLVGTLPVYLRELSEEDDQRRFLGHFAPEKLQDLSALFETYPTVYAASGEIAFYESSQIKTTPVSTYFEIIVEITHHSKSGNKLAKHPILQNLHDKLELMVDDL